MKKLLKQFIYAALFIASVSLNGDSVIRAKMYTDLKLLDPSATTALITQNHAIMIYDTLFGIDENFVPNPQMVDRYEISEDQLIWTFTLRDGQKWHDGTPVTAEDCVASLKRWGKTDGTGQVLFSNTTSLLPIDEKTFIWKLKKPFGFLLDSIGGSTSNLAIMMPKRFAELDPKQPMKEYIGSGPFIFNADEWIPGSKVVYLKNKDYLPRSEPPSYLAGGKVVKVDRVEWLNILDQTTALNALLKGEIDFFQFPDDDLVPLLKKDSHIKFQNSHLYPWKGMVFFNHEHPPFNNPEVRRAVLMGLDQNEFLAGVAGPETFTMACYSIYNCKSKLASEVGSEIIKNPSLEKAKAALKATNYDGRKIVILQVTDNTLTSKATSLLADLLKKMGMNVDVQAMDSATRSIRRAVRKPIDEGGWNIFVTIFAMSSTLDPTSVIYSADPMKGFVNRANDKQIEEYREAFFYAMTPKERQEIADKMQIRALEMGVFALFGDISTEVVYRDSLKGVLNGIMPVFWNISKE